MRRNNLAIQGNNERILDTTSRKMHQQAAREQRKRKYPNKASALDGGENNVRSDWKRRQSLEQT